MKKNVLVLSPEKNEYTAYLSLIKQVRARDFFSKLKEHVDECQQQTGLLKWNKTDSKGQFQCRAQNQQNP